MRNPKLFRGYILMCVITFIVLQILTKTLHEEYNTDKFPEITTEPKVIVEPLK